MMVEVSVIIPVYNVEKYLKKCLDSVVNQTFKDIEIICVNDGSSDNSFQILDEYSSIDSRIKVINQKNKGVSAARNKGLESASGKYIQFIDADDFIEEETIQKAHDAIVQTDSDVVCFASRDIKDGISKTNWNIELLIDSVHNNNGIIKDESKPKFIHAIWDKMYKKSFLDKARIKFIEDLHATEDGIFNLYCLYSNASFCAIDYIGYNRIDTGVSATSNRRKILNYAIESCKYMLKDDRYLKTDKNLKTITLEKMLGSLVYYYSFADNLKDKIYYLYHIGGFNNYLAKNMDKNFLKDIKVYKSIKRLNFNSKILKNIFNVTNTYSSGGKHKKITVAGIKFSLKIPLEKEQNKVVKYLKKEYINPYLKNYRSCFVLKNKKNFENQRIIWQYWGQGLSEKTPEIVKICFKSVDVYKGDYERIILTDDNIKNYIDFPDFVFEKLNNKQFSRAFFSDLLRVSLLSLYGGVWIDATVLLTGPIDENILNLDFFSYQRCKKPLDYKKWSKFNGDYFSWNKKFRVNWLSSFIIAKKDNIVMTGLRDILLSYWKKENKLHHYFLAHLVFDELMKHDQFAKFNTLKLADTIPHNIQINKNSTYTNELWEDITSKTNIHKLTYLKKPDESVSLLAYIFSLYEKEINHV